MREIILIALIGMNAVLLAYVARMSQQYICSSEHDAWIQRVNKN